MTQAETEARNERGVSRLGTYMLQGWVLTGDLCPTSGCKLPLVRTKDRSKYLCVLCDDPKAPELPISAKVATPQPVASKTVPAEKIDENVPSAQEESELQALLDESAPTDAALREERRKQGDQASKLLGQKMLAGWTLLDEICPNKSCYMIPLVRNKRKETLCVMCQKTFSETGKETSAPRATTVPVSTDAPISKSGPSRSSESAHLEEQSAADSVKRRKIEISSSAEQLDAILTIESLRKRLAELRDQLDNTHDLDRTQMLCNTITSCANAIAACQTVRHQC
ncbi:hypothetical protein DFS34DRAFT_591234 [Phlyctochytrium arcticum]|nr:hypothetical protein DFS34DRAFT_591234 [Phlyctochytrium arcticum]